ncbi:DNA-binding protein [Halobacteriales archaeon QS_4_66_20]|nr:MAG: DNA-binding protein [Halobacteriales archaeon QS_4_66_20]
MKHVRVSITANGREAEIHPMWDVMANAPFVDRSAALQWNFTGDGFGILHYVVGDVDAFEERIREIPEVLGYDIATAGTGRFYVYIRDATTANMRALFAPITQGGLVVIPPIRYHADGTSSFSLFGPDEEIQAALDTVPSPVEITIEKVGGLGATPATAQAHLSERQREAVLAAVELGYYEIPRVVSHEDVADAIDCAPSTAAEHLRKAESAIVTSVVGQSFR